jgi:hypothetical protein
LLSWPQPAAASANVTRATIAAEGPAREFIMFSWTVSRSIGPYLDEGAPPFTDSRVGGVLVRTSRATGVPWSIGRSISAAAKLR